MSRRVASDQTAPVLGALALKMLARLRSAGLMHIFLDHGALGKDDGANGKVSSPFIVFWDEFTKVLPYIDQACELLGLEPVQLPNQPFVYNSRTFQDGDSWASNGSDGNRVSLAKLASGYGALWNMQDDSPDGATNRILKSAIWFSEQQKNRGAAFRLLLSLFRAGFFSRRHALGLAVARLAQAFSADKDYSEILGLGFAGKEQREADRLVSEGGFNHAYFVEIGAWLLDETRRAIGRARAAASPDEWMTRIAETSGLIAATELFEHQFKVMSDLPEPYRIQFMALEEIRCDLGAISFCVRDELKDRVAMEESWAWASGLLKIQMDNGGLEAVSRLFSARLLLPDALLTPLLSKLPEMKIDRETKLFQDAPEAWKHYGLEVSHLAAGQFGIDHRIVRWSRIANIDEDNVEPKPMERNLAEIRPFPDRYKEATQSGDEQARLAIVEEVLSLYPNNDIYGLERAILHDEMGYSETALEELLENICLAPAEWMPWQSLGVVCRKLGRRGDEVAAKLISKTLKGKEDDSSA